MRVCAVSLLLLAAGMALADPVIEVTPIAPADAAPCARATIVAPVRPETAAAATQGTLVVPLLPDARQAPLVIPMPTARERIIADPPAWQDGRGWWTPGQRFESPLAPRVVPVPEGVPASPEAGLPDHPQVKIRLDLRAPRREPFKLEIWPSACP